jgi:transposase
MSVAAPLVLRPGDGARLRELTRSSTAPAGHVQRARMVLLAAQGLSNAEISRRVGTSRQTVIAWRARYEAGGIDALADLPRSGRPPVVDEPAVIVATLNPPPARLAVTHWSARLLANHLSRAGMPVSFAEVARIWRDWGLQPHRIETFKFSTDPQLEAKVRDVVGLYLDPPANAVVVCVDEKSQIQALDRTAPL